MSKRDELLAKAEQLINSGNLEEANKIMDEVKALNARANQAALNKDTNKGINFEGYSANVTSGTVIATMAGGSNGGTHQPSIFLNKGDKLADRVEPSANDLIILNQPNALGEVIKGMVTGRWVSPEFKNAISTTSTGTLIPQVLSSRIIDLARDLSLFTRAGVPVVPMTTNNTTLSRVVTDPVFKFKKEGEAANESTFELDGVELKSKTIYGYAYVSLEAINSSQNLDAVISQVFASAIAQGIDAGCLYGQYNGATYDTFAPAGVMNDANINSIAALDNNLYKYIIKAIGAIRVANGEPTVLGINAQTDESLNLWQDAEGAYIPAPKPVADLTKILSNQLAYDAAAGSDGLVFDPNALVIGIQENINVRMFEGDTESIKKGLVAFRVYAMIDCVTLQPKHITKITGMK